MASRVWRKRGAERVEGRGRGGCEYLLVAPMTTTWPREVRPSMRASRVDTMELWIWSCLLLRICTRKNTQRCQSGTLGTHLETAVYWMMKARFQQPHRVRCANFCQPSVCECPTMLSHLILPVCTRRLSVYRSPGGKHGYVKFLGQCTVRIRHVIAGGNWLCHTGARPSISSKKMMEGWQRSASANSSRSIRSASPTHLDRMSAP